MTNHDAHDNLKIFERQFQPLVKAARAIIDSSHSAGRTDSERKLCADLYSQIVKIEDEVVEKFVLDNRNRPAGAYVFNRYMQRSNLRLLDSIYKLFDPGMYSNSYLLQMRKKIDGMYNLFMQGSP